MKALSIWEPWASLIRCGAKTIETRHWGTKYRGPLLICAAKGGLSMEGISALLCQKAFWKGLETIAQPGHSVRITDLNHGKMVAKVNLIDCIRTEDITVEQIGGNGPYGDFSSGRYAWMFSDIIPVKMARVAGGQRIFNVDDHLIHHEEATSAT